MQGKFLRKSGDDRVDDFRVRHRHDASGPDLDRLDGTDRRAGSHGGEIRGHEKDGPRAPSVRPDWTDPAEDRYVPGVVEHLRDRHRLSKTSPRCVEPDHGCRVSATPCLTHRLLQVVDGGTIDRASYLGEEDPRPLTSDHGQRAGHECRQKRYHEDDAHLPPRTKGRSFLSPFRARAAVRDATSPVMSPAAVVFVTTIMFFSRAISVSVCSSRRRMALGAEPYSMAASRIFSAGRYSPSAMISPQRRSRSASARLALGPGLL